ncbi:MAG: alanine racemase [Myxococcales bacterium]|jgi:alanine racemase|nr:alanine racemase [Myxococcales bacterium]
MAFSSDNSFSRPTCAQIDLAALRHNLRRCRELVSGTGIRLLAVVKANAYGHGAVPIAQELARFGVDCFGISLVEEGVELRQAGIQGDIVVLGGAWSDDDEIVANALTPLVFSRDQLVRLDAAAARAGSVVRVHLKLDTGMSRIGITLAELPDFLTALSAARRVHVEGLASHLANSECLEHPQNAEQLALFRQARAVLKAAGHDPRWCHIANSGALLQLGEARDGADFNLVRPGIMLYGEAPSLELSEVSGLRAVLSWRTSITHLKTIEEGQPVSYGGRWTAPRRSRIATLPVGYADGYNRRFGNVAEVLIRGQRAPVVGTVCMDMCMVDVTRIDGVSLRDEAVLLGCQGEQEITARELAERIGTISYEILTSVGARVPRVVVDSDESQTPRSRDE